MTAALQSVEFPPRYDRDTREEILRPLRHSVWRAQRWSQEDAAYRRALTAASPLHFALGFLGPYLQDQVTGTTSFCEMHLAANRIIAGWREPAGSRYAVAAWREAGKSTWFNLIGPLWALGHGYARFPHLFSLTDAMARGKLRRLLALLRGHHRCSAALLRDFPELRLIRSSAGRYELAGGAVIVARGMGATTLGEVDVHRPDVLLVDDPQQPEARNTDEWVRKGKSTIRTAILPMNVRAHVAITGTVTMIGDLMDDVVRLARSEVPRGPDKGAWLTGEGFTCRYFPLDWPQRHPDVASMREQAQVSPEHLRAHALSYEPHLLGTEAAARYWPVAGGWQYGKVGAIGKRCIFVDEAYSSRKGADQTAMAVMSIDTSGRWVCVEHVKVCGNGMFEKRAMIEKLHRWAIENLPPPLDDPHITIGIESVRDGDGAVDALGPYPPGSRPIGYHPGQTGKARRIEGLHRRYVERGIVHRVELAEFEAQAQAWHPRATWDDMLDVVSAGDRWLRTGSAEM